MENKSEHIYPEGRAVNGCHMCHNSNLDLVLDLGMHPHSDLFLTEDQLSEQLSLYPLRLVTCRNCGLLQIDYLVDPRILYQREYLYESSITSTGRLHYNEMAQQIKNKFKLKKDQLVIDLGSNVGVLLEGFRDLGMKVLGVDPAPIVAQKAIDRGIETIIDFFNTEVAQRILNNYGKATIVAGTNVFAHIHELDSAVAGMKMLLDNSGVIVIEAPYAIDFIDHLEYDTIYHQHIGYLSIQPMKKYFEKFGMELFDVEYVSIHGGSMRYFIGLRGAHKISSSVDKGIEAEEAFGLYNLEKLKKFSLRVKKQREDLSFLLWSLKNEGKKIVGISAPAKGNTLLNYCSIGTNLVDFLTEKSQLKIGRHTPGTLIPIFDDQKLLDYQPDYALILAWNFAEEIMRNNEEYRKRGGKFIIPIPSPKII